MIKIYHNNRCRKSREAVLLIKKITSKYKIIEYIKNKLTFEEIEMLLLQLKMPPINLIRHQERIWKNKYKNLNLTKNEIINAMVEHPELIQRPIIVNNEQAIIGRPAKNILNFLNYDGI